MPLKEKIRKKQTKNMHQNLLIYQIKIMRVIYIFQRLEKEINNKNYMFTWILRVA